VQLAQLLHNRTVGGFIVLEDGREYFGANWATDATIRAIAQEVPDTSMREWMLLQQSTVVGLGMTCVDLREMSPVQRSMLHVAIRAAYARVRAEGFEGLDEHNKFTAGWLNLFREFVEELDRCEAGEPRERKAR
jgi:hypothetical protein